MERSEVRSFYRLAAFLVCAYAAPFAIGDEMWISWKPEDTLVLAE